MSPVPAGPRARCIYIIIIRCLERSRHSGMSMNEWVPGSCSQRPRKQGRTRARKVGHSASGPVGAAQPLQGPASTGLLLGLHCSTQVLVLPVGSTASQVSPSRGGRGKSVTVQGSLTGKAGVAGSPPFFLFPSNCTWLLGTPPLPHLRPLYIY